MSLKPYSLPAPTDLLSIPDPYRMCITALDRQFARQPEGKQTDPWHGSETPLEALPGMHCHNLRRAAAIFYHDILNDDLNVVPALAQR